MARVTASAAKGNLPKLRGHKRGAADERFRDPVSVITDHPMVTIVLFMVVGMAVIFYVSWRHHVGLEHSSAIRAAAAYSEAVTSIRDFYSRQIVPRAREAGVTVSHDYRSQPGTIPFPATMNIDLGDDLANNGSGTHYRLYSDLPFPWRRERTIDKFEREALDRLTANPNEPVIRFDLTPDGKILRYATAVVMNEACVACHNAMSESPRKGWKIGEVRGVQMITVPLPDRKPVAVREIILLTLIAGFAILLMWSMMSRLQSSLRRTRELALISDRRNTELIIAKGEAERANAAKTRFLASMSHELRTPLNSIIGFADVLRNADAIPHIKENVVEYATDIHTSGQHLLDLINEILDMSKIEAGMLELVEETVNLQETVHTCTRLVSRRAEDGKVAIIDDIAPSFPPIRGDRRAMRQVLLNLLSNAVKFTAEGGYVKIDAGIDGSGVWITVLDTGIGIPEGQMQAIFEPFTQADNSTTRQHEGTGLGLPITKALVELHGGRLTLSSEVGKGTRALVQLPSERIIHGPRD